MRNPLDNAAPSSVLQKNLRNANYQTSIVTMHRRRGYGARRILFSPENDPGGAPAPSPAPAPAPSPAPAPAPAPGGGPSPSAGNGDPPAAYRPDGLPDHLYGKNDQETIDKLSKAYAGARTAVGEMGSVPDKPEGYTFEAGEKLAPFVKDFDKDPVYNAVRGIAKESGLTDKQFKVFMPKVLEHFVTGGLVESPMNTDEVLQSLAPKGMENATPEERKTAGAKRVTDTIAWVDTAKQQGTIPPAVADFLSASAADDPKAIGLVDWLRGNSQETRPAMDGGRGGSGPTEADLKARNLDPRNNPSAKEYDPAFAAETDRQYRAFYG